MGRVWVSYLHQSWVRLVQIGVYLHQSLPRDCRLVFICTRVDWETADWCLQPDKTAASAICTKLTLSSGTFALHPIWWEFVLRASKSNLFFQDFVESTWITRHIGLGLVCGVSQSISQSGLNIDSDSAGRLPWVLLTLCLVQPKKEKTANKYENTYFQDHVRPIIFVDLGERITFRWSSTWNQHIYGQCP